MTLIGRGVSVINTGGEKVYPAEVEEVIGELAGVEDCLVMAVPDERFGQLVAAMVVRSQTTIPAPLTSPPPSGGPWPVTRSPGWSSSSATCRGHPMGRSTTRRHRRCWLASSAPPAPSTCDGAPIPPS